MELLSSVTSTSLRITRNCPSFRMHGGISLREEASQDGQPGHGQKAKREGSVVAAADEGKDGQQQQQPNKNFGGFAPRLHLWQHWHNCDEVCAQPGPGLPANVIILKGGEGGWCQQR